MIRSSSNNDWTNEKERTHDQLDRARVNSQSAVEAQSGRNFVHGA